jgi:uncharacterized protein (DUF302 family)
MRIALLALFGLLMVTPVRAADMAFAKDVEVVETGQPFLGYLEKLKAAITANKMGVVGLACATCGAQNIGVTIAENRVVMIFNPHFAVRMLAASVPTGVEAPLRLYLTERDDGTAVLSYRKPSLVFAPYSNAELDVMAKELDRIVARIVSDAAR